MNNVLSKVILVLIIILPIIICLITLDKVWEDDENDNTIDTENSGDIGSGIIVSIEDVSGETEQVTGEMAGEQYISTIGKPISKLYSDAEVSISVANVYTESNENSEIVGTLEKYTTIIAQKYPEGWSRVTNNTIAGWMRTENISFPEGATTLETDGVKIGKIKAEPYLNVRASANSNAEIITRIPNGTEITIKEEVSGWYKVTYASATGWISADYVEVK